MNNVFVNSTFSENELYIRYRNISRILAYFTLFVALFTLSGWIFNIPFLIRLFKGMGGISPPTIICSILSAFSLLILSNEKKSKSSYNIPIILSLIVIIISLWGLATNLINSLASLNKFYISHSSNSSEFAIMSVVTSFNFLIIGSAHILISSSNHLKHLGAQIFAIIIFFISLFSIYGYIYGVQSLYMLSVFKGLSLYTSIIIFALSISTFLVKPKAGMVKKFSENNLLWTTGIWIFISIIILIPLIDYIIILGEKAKIYDSIIGSGISVIINVLLLTIILWIGMYYIDNKEKAIKRADRALLVLSYVNKELTKIRGESEFLKNICKIIVEIGGYSLAWIGYAKHDSKKGVRIVAQYGYSDDYLKNVKISWEDNEWGRGPTGIAIRESKISIARDILGNPEYKPWREEALKRGYKSSIALPIKIENKVIGALNIYAPEEDAFFDDELKLLTEITDDIGLGVKTIRTKKEKALAEKLLGEEQGRFEHILRSIADGVILADLNSKIILMNKSAKEITEWEYEKDKWEIEYILRFKNIGKEKIKEVVEEVIKKTKIIKIENHPILITKTGVEKVIELTFSPLYNYQSKVIGILIIFKDITKQINMEEELINTEKLKSLTLLIGGVAHDFNNFLTAIISNITYAKILAMENSEITEVLGEAEKASLNARNLTRQLLTLAKGSEPIKKVVSVAELIKETVKFAIRGSKVKLKLEISENLFSARLDEGQITQVIQNIIVNALQSMPQGGTLHILAENIFLEERNQYSLKPGRYVKIIIKDTGKGIPADIMPKIFNPFFTTKKDGNGLGLYTSYRIVKKHHGDMFVGSEVGKGTIFTILLPAIEITKKVVSKEQEVDNVLKKRYKILIMDDESIIRKSTSHILKIMGYEVDTASNGEEALKKYRNTRYDVVITDLTIPGGMGGKELVKELLKIDPDARVIVSSGYATDPAIINFTEAGFKSVLIKPYSIDEIKKSLKEVFHYNQ